jgi:hypothetical protein
VTGDRPSTNVFLCLFGPGSGLSSDRGRARLSPRQRSSVELRWCVCWAKIGAAATARSLGRRQ